MKKRLLAFTLTLVMILTSASVIPFATSAEEINSNIIVAKASPDKTATSNIGELSDAYAYYNFAEKKVTLAIYIVDISEISVTLGGFEANIHSFTTDSGTQTTVSASMDIASSTHSKATFSIPEPYDYILITIPLSEIKIKADASGNATSLMYVEVNNGGQSSKNYEQTVMNGIFDGILIFELPTETKTHSGMSGMKVANTVMISNKLSASGVATLNDDKSALTVIESNGKKLATNRREYIYESIGNEMLTSPVDRQATFDVTINDMTAYDFTTTPYTKDMFSHGQNGAISNGTLNKKFERFIYGLCGNIDGTDGDNVGGAMVVDFLRDSSKGLIMVHCDTSGKLTEIVLGDVFGEKLSVKLIWDKDNSGSIYVNNELKATLGNALTSTVTDNTSSQILYFSSKCGNGYSSFNYIGVSGTSPLCFDAKVENYQLKTTKAIATADDIAALGASDIKLSYIQESAVSDGKFDVRFTATVKTLEAGRAGFQISLGEGEPVDLNKTTSNVVFKSILQNVDNNIEAITAPRGEYLSSVAITGVPSVGTYTFKVTPVLVSSGEIVSQGTAYGVTYTDGKFISCTEIS